MTVNELETLRIFDAKLLENNAAVAHLNILSMFVYKAPLPPVGTTLKAMHDAAILPGSHPPVVTFT